MFFNLYHSTGLLQDALHPLMDGEHPPFGVGKGEFHYGFDIANTVGTPVYAPANGVVTKANYSSGYGLNIIIQHKFGYKSIFAHLNRMYVRVGGISRAR